MEFRDVVRKRRMCRRFTGEPVAAQVVERMLRHAVRAPNAGFTQGWAFIVLSNPADRDRFWHAATPTTTLTGQTRSTRNMSTWLDGMRTAPVIIVVLTSKAAYLQRYAQKDKGWNDLDESRWPVPFWYVDAGMASLLILQTAVDEGLGACFFGIPPDGVSLVKTALTVVDEYEIVGAIAVGHPAEGGTTGSVKHRTRRPMTEVVHHGRFHEPNQHPQ